MIEYYNDKQESQNWKDDRFYRPAKFNEPKEKLMDAIEERVTVAFNDGFFSGVILSVALGLFVWSAWLLFA